MKVYVILLYVLFSSIVCSADIYDDIVKNGYFGIFYGYDTTFSYSYQRELLIIEESKLVNFYCLPEGWGDPPLQNGIEYSKCVVDRKNKTISYYTKDDNRLIITIKIVDEKTQAVQIVDYGEWLYNTRNYKPKDGEINVILSFSGGDFNDPERIYKPEEYYKDK